MSIIYWDVIGGISGDMMVGALLQCGGDEKRLLKELKKLPLKPWKWQRRTLKRQSFAGEKVDFIISEEQPCRHLQDIENLIATAAYPEAIAERIVQAFRLLAKAESKAHGIPENEVHFHEVGADDTILDIAAVVLLLDQLGITSLYASPLVMGTGSGESCHGIMPLPAPALNYLLEGVPVLGIDEAGETVTPTGIALLKAYHTHFGLLPPMTVEKTGVGAGTREGKRPNILRCFRGTPAKHLAGDYVFRLSCSVDDCCGEDLGALWDQVFEAGALDMQITPVQMKKGRPGQRITVLSSENKVAILRDCLLRNTSTWGVTCEKIERAVLTRREKIVKTPLGNIRFKVGEGYGITKAKPEFADLYKLAKEHGLSLTTLREVAMAAYGEECKGERKL